MNYYEELGVGRDASPDEIRKAFRGVTRMLHPDKQQDEKLQLLASAQMRRLNEVIETLGDPHKRAAYDLGLSGEQREPVPVEIVHSTPFPALIAGLVFGCLAMYCISLFFGSELSRSESQPFESIPVRSNPETVSTPRSRRVSRAKPALVSQSTAPVPEQASATVPEIPLLSPAPLVAADIDVAEEFALIPPVAQPLKREGIWLHAMDAKGKPANWAYKAEYVELRLREFGGEILGAYRSRYRIPDKLLQPEVTFRFRGPLSDQEFSWESAQGARGIIRLQMQSENVMEASWKVSVAGDFHGLASGSATLVRRMD